MSFMRRRDERNFEFRAFIPVLKNNTDNNNNNNLGGGVLTTDTDLVVIPLRIIARRSRSVQRLETPL